MQSAADLKQIYASHTVLSAALSNSAQINFAMCDCDRNLNVLYLNGKTGYFNQDLFSVSTGACYKRNI